LNDLLQFAEGNFLLEQRGDTLVFSDLRFGQILGWEDPRRPFVFQYYLGKGDAVNRLALQRGRLTGWSGPRLRRFLQRIGGR
jgi:inner membrane protein